MDRQENFFFDDLTIVNHNFCALIKTQDIFLWNFCYGFPLFSKECVVFPFA